MTGPTLARCRTCSRVTPADRPRCVACRAPWRLSRRKRLYVEVLTTTWAPVFVLAVALGGAG